MLARSGENRTLVHCWWEYKMVQLLWKTVWLFLTKLTEELQYESVVPLLSVYPKKTDFNKYLYTQVNSSVIHNSQKIEATQVTTDR